MKERFKFIIAGFCVGFAELLPGISGSTVAIFFGIYEKLINILSELKIKNISLNYKKLNSIFLFDLIIPFIIAMILSVLIFSNLILFLHNEFTYIFNILIGLIMILGGYFLLKDLIRLESKTMLIFFIGFITSLLLSNLSSTSININFINLIFAGFIAFSFFLIPGISGSAILLVFGLYSLIIESISVLNFSVLLPFAIGGIISLLTMPKLISYLYEKYRDLLIMFFSGLIIGTGLLIII
ncbi:MAG: DUF368 domain-containing protein [SAR86 cluster bacterium]|jgi:putative membrane protein|uniref:DUF368 domain-containing protein n=1 Tax=SAR86 cluster bacterium TaxID=2030880 RepID=A0A520MCC8_9GAMM|nr:MAG: DUF368 domain-containing protein [SAR86 cluster bacterium]